MPFADGARRVTERFETVGNRFFGFGQTKLRARAIKLMAEARLIAARHQSSARRAAIRSGNVALRETDAILRNRINVRRWDLLVALEPKLAVTDIVTKNDNNIRAGRRFIRRARGNQRGE